MGNSKSHHVEHHHHHVNVVSAEETAKKQEELRKKKEEEERLKKEAEEEAKKSLAEQVRKQMDQVLTNLGKLNLTDPINKKPSERHVGVVSNVSAGKTTMSNVMFGLKNKTAASHCTTDCEKIYQDGNLHFWDTPGEDAKFKYYKEENIAFVKSLDMIIVLFDDDIANISNTLKLVNTVNPGNITIVRTKADSVSEDDERTVAEELVEDSKKVERLLGVKIPVFAISSHNIKKNRGDRYDWDIVKKMIYG